MFRRRATPRRRSAVILCACCIAFATATAAFCQEPTPAEATGKEVTEFRSLLTHPADDLPAADADLIQSNRRAIADEAAFWGYHLNAGSWTHEETVCGEIPDYVVLHYRAIPKPGAEFLFTALVPRQKGRVLVVPVYYGNTTPIRPAPESDHTIAVFNRAVPAELAARAAQQDGPWLSLAMCYAAVAGADPHVPEQTDANMALLQAPLPTLKISEENPAMKVVFTDRDAHKRYTIWTVTLNKGGRVTAATARGAADYSAQPQHGSEPKVRTLPPEAPENPARPQPQ